MLGAIAGDVIGSVHEWARTKTKHFPLLTARSRFTDDTVLTVAVADCLLQGRDYVDGLHDYFHAYPDAGYGGSFGRWANSRHRTIDGLRPMYAFDVSCQGSVPPSIMAFLESTGYEDAVRNAVSPGGDADTMACIAGAIAEAFYGGVPEAIAAPVLAALDERLRSVVIEFRGRFGAGACAPPFELAGVASEAWTRKSFACCTSKTRGTAPERRPVVQGGRGPTRTPTSWTESARVRRWVSSPAGRGSARAESARTGSGSSARGV